FPRTLTTAKTDLAKRILRCEVQQCMRRIALGKARSCGSCRLRRAKLNGRNGPANSNYAPFLAEKQSESDGRIASGGAVMPVQMRIKVNGQTYNSVEEMPPDVREQYQKAMSSLPDRDGNGVPDIFEGRFETAEGLMNIMATTQRYVVNGT